MIVRMVGGGPQDGLVWTVPELPPWFVFPCPLLKPPVVTPEGGVLERWRAVYVQVGDTDRYTYQGEEKY